MNIEVKEDSTYQFSFTKYVNDSESNISAATISIKSPGGTEYLASTAMSVSGATATYSVDFSSDPSAGTYSIDRNYLAILTIDGTVYNRFFDIVRYPFVNECTIVDLQKENRRALDLAGYKLSGDAESGTTTTLVDSRLIGQDTFVGGIVEVFPTDNDSYTQTATVTLFNDSTGEVTFSPALSTAVSTNAYSIRRSFSEDIDRAGEVVKTDLWKREQRAYLVIDYTQLKQMIVYKFFERMFAKRRTSTNDDDRDHVQYMYYSDQYSAEVNGLPLIYDMDNDGAISDDEDGIKDGIRFVR